MTNESIELLVRSVKAQLYVNLTDFMSVLDNETMKAVLEGSISAKDLLERLLHFKDLNYTWESFLSESQEDEKSIRPIFEKFKLNLADVALNCNICGKQGDISLFETFNESLGETELICPQCGSLSVQEI